MHFTDYLRLCLFSLTVSDHKGSGDEERGGHFRMLMQGQGALVKALSRIPPTHLSAPLLWERALGAWPSRASHTSAVVTVQTAGHASPRLSHASVSSKNNQVEQPTKERIH